MFLEYYKDNYQEYEEWKRGAFYSCVHPLRRNKLGLYNYLQKYFNNKWNLFMVFLIVTLTENFNAIQLKNNER